MSTAARILIRPATSSDRDALKQLARRLADFELPPWRTAHEIADADARAMIAAVAASRNDDEVFIAERSGREVGCLHILATTDFFGRRHAHLSVIATSVDAAGSGVGRALMDFAEAWSRERGLTMLTLNVFANNTGARRFYEKSGMEPEVLKYVKEL
jgi:ribosomal protein S18 acetylase RimI-like enzyme